MLLQIEPGFNESDRPFKKHGRPSTGHGRSRVVASIESAQRNRLVALGLKEHQLEQALAYCRRGYTVPAATRLVLAGGMRRGLFNGFNMRARVA